jgi:hypothetical protein
LEERIERNHIQAIYCGPDCDVTARDHVAMLSASYGLKHFEINFAIREVVPHFAIALKPKPLIATKLSAERRL